MAINAITMYCGVEEGPATRWIPPRCTVKDDSPLVLKVEECDALSQAVKSIKAETRPTTCFVCLGNPALTLRERVAKYATSGSLSRHFLRKHVRKLQGGEHIDCQLCRVRLENRVELLIHAERFYGTDSRGPAEKLIS